MDSGCSSAVPVLYRAVQQGTVRLDGGFTIPTSTFVAVPNKPYLVAPLPDGVPKSGGFNRGWHNCSNTTRGELFYGVPTNLQPGVEARHPNVGTDGNWRWMRQGKTFNSTAFGARQEGGLPIDPSKWATAESLKTLWVHGFWHFDWTDTYERVLSITKPGTVVHGRAKVTTEWTYTIDAVPAYGLSTGSRYYVVRSLTLLDAPNEYIVTNDSVYFYPPKTPSITDPGVEVVLSAASRLLTLNSTRYLTFEGIMFGVARDVAVSIANSTGVIFRNCSIANVGGDALVIDGGATGNAGVKIDNTHMWGIGCTGISLKQIGNETSLTPGAVELTNSECTFSHL